MKTKFQKLPAKKRQQIQNDIKNWIDNAKAFREKYHFHIEQANKADYFCKASAAGEIAGEYGLYLDDKGNITGYEC